MIDMTPQQLMLRRPNKQGMDDTEKRGIGIESSENNAITQPLMGLVDSHDYLSVVSPIHHSSSPPHAPLYFSHQAQCRVDWKGRCPHHLPQRFHRYRQVIRHFPVSYGPGGFAVFSVLAPRFEVGPGGEPQLRFD